MVVAWLSRATLITPSILVALWILTEGRRRRRSEGVGELGRVDAGSILVAVCLAAAGTLIARAVLRAVALASMRLPRQGTLLLEWARA